MGSQRETSRDWTRSTSRGARQIGPSRGAVQRPRVVEEHSLTLRHVRGLAFMLAIRSRFARPAVGSVLARKNRVGLGL